MAVVNVVPVNVNRTGVPAALPAGVVPDLTQTFVPNTGQTNLVIIVGATTSTVTVLQNQTVDGVATAGRVYSTGVLTANGTFVLGPFPQTQYGTSLNVLFANATTIKIGALENSGTN